MAGVKLNFDAIQKAAEAAIKTDEAKSEAKKAFRNYINGSASGGKLVDAGSGKAVPTKLEMRAIADDFVNILVAEAGGVPGSIAALLQSTIMVGPIEKSEGMFVYEIEIPVDSLHRDSLFPAKYSGVDNIIALFDDGYVASDYVYGYNKEGKRIRSMISREPLNFMSTAAEKFNDKYSSKYNVELRVGWN